CRIAFSSDSFVIDPIFFPGGDIGKLAVCGTVNDVATSGASPRYLSCSMIIEEGFALEDLRKICNSISKTAKKAGVKIVTGDTKVVEKGHADNIFINTTGIGVFEENVQTMGAENIKVGDSIILTGYIADHGIAIIGARQGLEFIENIKSDCALLNKMISSAMNAAPGKIHAFRDPTRGGIASTLNELAQQSNTSISVSEEKIPIRPQTKAACQMLGLEPYQVANEGKMLCFVDQSSENEVLEALRQNEYGKNSAVIGRVKNVDEKLGPRVFLETAIGSKRIMDNIVGEILPRIC
ncbi:MAG: hydrogenase expression/formation protein HypE, partial [Eggerthellaceae bacterium]|nr:hydrogenase expression/formation protein HypE [Eggerthellaceae bacterium]